MICRNSCEAIVNAAECWSSLCDVAPWYSNANAVAHRKLHHIGNCITLGTASHWELHHIGNCITLGTASHWELHHIHILGSTCCMVVILCSGRLGSGRYCDAAELPSCLMLTILSTMFLTCLFWWVYLVGVTLRNSHVQNIVDKLINIKHDSASAASHHPQDRPHHARCQPSLQHQA